MKRILILTVLGLILASSLLTGQSNSVDMVSMYLDSLKKSFPELNSIQLSNARLIILKFQKIGDEDLRKLAYILATAYHESKFYPIKEQRAKPGTDVYNVQNKYWDSGFYGRGFVQLTLMANYEKFSRILGIDLVKNPDLALNDNVAAFIINYGMLNGSFTGRKLSDYINFFGVDYVAARKIVNGTDRAELIASYAEKINQNVNPKVA